MRLADSTLSLAAAFAASQSLFRFASSSAVATVVDKAYESESESKQLDYSNASSRGEECSFSNSYYLKGSGADTGILGCSDPEYVCIQDSLSSLGGRCAPAAMAHCKLFNTTCTVKCTGTDACTGSLDPNNIGVGSCCGYKACYGVSASSTIGDGSCIGYKACYKAQDATIGDGSCTGDSIKGVTYYGFSCGYLKGDVGDKSCFEYAACYQTVADLGIFNVGYKSCIGRGSCEYTGNYKIGDNSCNEFYACYKNYGTVSYNSCNAKLACKTSTGYIKHESCNGEYACYYNGAEIGVNSCNARQACERSTAPIGDNVCNAYQICINNASPVPSATPAPNAPTKSPSKSAPTEVPTAAPTKKPTTAAPTNNPTQNPTNNPVTPLPTNSPTTKPTNNPTKTPTTSPTKKPVTNTPTSKPVTAAPSNQPTRTSTTLLFSVDLCFPGCGNFSAVNTNSTFEEVIKTYVPCSPMQCVVTVVDSATSSCETCNISSSRRLRFLQESEYKTSAVLFEIVSNTPLVEQEVLANLNSNIANANSDLAASTASFRVQGNFVAASLQPTSQPTKKQSTSSKSTKAKSSKKPTSPSSKPGSKSAKDTKDPKDSRNSSKDDKRSRMM
eukprot:CCRYP_010194-RB/>CCRYP_010194-RB protein AED:0.08 eAED:0.08 QI:227/1/1/1/0.72/0.61/26/1764/612